MVGLVPNGAMCAKDRMCINQKCVSVDVVRSRNVCPDNCNNNGDCDNEGRCHCYDDFAQPHCLFPVPQSYRLTVALYVIFLCVLPLTAVAAFIIYHFHGQIKRWLEIKARQANLRSRAKLPMNRTKHARHPIVNADVDLRTLEISEPIPADVPPPPLPFARSGRKTQPNSSASSSYRDARKHGNLNISSPVNVLYDSSSETQRPRSPLSSGDVNSAHLLQPSRPAPPPPVSIISTAETQRTPLSMGASVTSMSHNHQHRSSMRSNNGAGLARPNCPPPPRPQREKDRQSSQMQSCVSGGSSTADRILNFENTRLSFVHVPNDSATSRRTTDGSGATFNNSNRSCNGPAPPVPTSLSSHRSNSSDGHHQRKPNGHGPAPQPPVPKVAALTKRFERNS